MQKRMIILTLTFFEAVDEVYFVEDDEYNFINVDTHKIIIIECNNPVGNDDQDFESGIEINNTQYELRFLMRTWLERIPGGKIKWNGEVHCRHGKQFQSWWCYRRGDIFAQQYTKAP